jgi:hypothetical protein
MFSATVTDGDDHGCGPAPERARIDANPRQAAAIAGISDNPNHHQVRIDVGLVSLTRG